jgi:hypothetical protein
MSNKLPYRYLLTPPQGTAKQFKRECRKQGVTMRHVLITAMKKFISGEFQFEFKNNGESRK